VTDLSPVAISPGARLHALLLLLAHDLRAVSLAFNGKQTENDMNRDQMKGITQQVKGKVNEVVGRATGNRTQELKGDLQQAALQFLRAQGAGRW
jgi:uncharacterized protein YjbJ (UPF0337 family)